MLNNFISSFNTVFPLFAILLLGAFLNKKGLCTQVTQKETNNIVFKALLPTLIFKNVFYTNFESDFKLNLVIFVVIATLLGFVLVSIVSYIVEKKPKTRGALIHCSFRTNSLIYGMAILVNMYGTEKLGSASIALAIVIPMINILAVYTLEKNRGGKVERNKIFKAIATNPVIIATGFAVILRILGINTFPTFVTASIEAIADMATPVALLFLGASVEFSKVRQNRRNLTIGVLTKLFILPAIVSTVAISLGFRNLDLGVILTMFASPTAITSFPMAVAMDSDYELTGEIVAFTTALASITMFLWIFLFKQMSLI